METFQRFRKFIDRLAVRIPFTKASIKSQQETQAVVRQLKDTVEGLHRASCIERGVPYKPYAEMTIAEVLKRDLLKKRKFTYAKPGGSPISD